MKIKLYEININTREKNLHPINLEIDGKLISYPEYPDYSNSDYPSDGFFEERFFNYEYDNSFKTKFKKLKLNYRFMINAMHEEDDATIANVVGYGHLNYFKKIRLDWIFKKTWIQNNENIKWLLGLIASFVTGYLIGKWT